MGRGEQGAWSARHPSGTEWGCLGRCPWVVGGQAALRSSCPVVSEATSRIHVSRVSFILLISLLLVDLLIQFCSVQLNRRLLAIYWVPGAGTTERCQVLPSSQSRPRGPGGRPWASLPALRWSRLTVCMLPSVTGFLGREADRSPRVCFGRKRKKGRGKAGGEGAGDGMSRAGGGEAAWGREGMLLHAPLWWRPRAWDGRFGDVAASS